MNTIPVQITWSIAATLLLWVLQISAALAIGAPGTAVSLDEVGAGELLFRTAAIGQYLPALQLDTQVEITVSGLVAEVTVRQQFKNPGDEWAEGVYVFPLPETAAVNAMEIRIGERTIVGDIRERQQARTLYKEAKQAGKRAALVEQRRSNSFATAVANIAPGQDITITLRYLQKVAYEHGRFSLRFPMTITPRYIAGKPLSETEQTVSIAPGTGWAVNTDQVPDASEITPWQNPRPATPTDPVNMIRLTAVIDPGMPLAEVASTYHDIHIVRKDGVYRVVLVSDTTSMDRDFELSWQPVRSRTPQAALFNQTVGNDHYALLMVLPPEQTSAVRLPREAIFIIDTSGSMGGESIRQAKAALRQALNRLQPGDRFNIVEFNSMTRTLFSDAVPATPQNLQWARGFVARLEAGGGTEMAAAIRAALENQSERPRDVLRQVVFITDGSVGNETALFQLIEQHLGTSRLFTVGIGSAPNSYFMRKAAQFGRGIFTYIGSTAEVQQKMAALFTQLEQPLLRDFTITWPRGTVPEAFPVAVPDLYRGQPLIVTARLKRLTGALQITGQMADVAWRRTIALDTGRRHTGIAMLWARDKIGALGDEIVRQGETDELKAAILDIALRNRLISRYTSFVAIEKQPARPANAKLKSGNVPNARPQGQSPQPFAYPQTATPAVERFWAGLVCLLLVVLIVAFPSGNRSCAWA